MYKFKTKMVPVTTPVQLLCVVIAFALASAHVSAAAQVAMKTGPSEVRKMGREPTVHWGPQNFLGFMMPTKRRRSDMDNSINPFASPPSHSHDISPEAEALGESIMEEFITFLTLKDAGLLDFCLQLK